MRARERHGLDPDMREFPAGTKTAADTADAGGCDMAQIASSLMFDADGSLVVTLRECADVTEE